MIKNSKLGVIVLLLSAFLFGGCASTPPEISSTQLFQGYPCQDNCKDFAAGFETARNQKFTKNEQCDSVSSSLHLGCLTYIHEYKLEHEQPLGYVFPSK